MSKITFLELFREYVKFRRNSSDKFERIKPQTIRHYYNKQSLVSDYLFLNNIIKIKAMDFDSTQCTALFNYMDEKQYAHNYSVRTVQLCISALDFGAEKGIIPNNPAIYWKMKKLPPKEPIYLCPDQIKQIESYQTSCSMKRKGADMFILQLHTGFNYGDFKEVKRHHVILFKDTKYLIKPRHKNGNKQVVPLSDVAERVLEHYDYKMQLLSNPGYNKVLKLIATDLKIPHELKCKDGRVIFMMNKLNNEGYSMEATSKMGGHKSVRTTEAYYAQVDINLIHNEYQKKCI